MTHEIESAFFVKTGAWHGLGKVLSAPPSLEEVLVQAGLDSPVEDAPLYSDVVTPNGVERIEVKSHKLILRARDKQQLGVTTKAYRPHQPQEALEFMRPLIESGAVQFEAGGSLREGKRAWLLGRYSDPIDVKTGDTLIPYILWGTGYDGTCATQVMNTPVRVQCANTLYGAGFEDSGEELDFGFRRGKVSINHIGDPAKRFERAREILVLARRKVEDAVEVYRAMANKPVDVQTVQEFASEVFDDDYRRAKQLIAKLKVRVQTEESEIRAKLQAKLAELEELVNTPSRVRGQIVDAFEEAPGAKAAGSTVWGMFNAATYYLDHVRGKDAGRRLDHSWFGDGRGLRAKAFAEAAKLLV